MDKVKLLYVEDEPYLARIVQESLETRGFDVHLTGDGGEAVGVFKRIQPDVCVLDVMLPHQDGYSIAREIRKLNPLVPIIFLTAKNQTSDLIKGFDSGGNDFLKKPFSMEELIVRINNLLDIVSIHGGIKRAGNSVEKRILGAYVFYPRCYELHGPIKELKKLSHRENRLLQLLTDDPGQPVLRRNILLDIWGDDSYSNSRNLDVYISRLRDFLSGDRKVKINTIKGVGYHLQVELTDS